MTWHVEYIPESRCWSVFDEHGCCVVPGLPHKEHADLIAAAPQMRDACTAFFNRWSNTRADSPLRVIGDDDAALLRAIIAKSRGQS